MSPQAFVPSWVVPTPRALTDCHWIAHACAEEAGPGSRFAKVLEVMDWVTTKQPTREQAQDMMMAADGGAYDTIVWLLGHAPAPVTVPRRNPDGSVMTADQLYAETTAAKWGEPEQKAEARRKATKDAALYRRLAAFVPH